MQFAFCTNTGRRLRNEDNCYIPREGDLTRVVLVADGMGGHAAGMRASAMAAEGIAALLSKKKPPQDMADSVHEAIQRVNLSIYRRAQSDPGCRGMGTTLTLCAFLEGGRYVAANVGDSRLYQFDGHVLTQVTTDHSLVAVLVAKGEITQAEAAQHPQRNIITRALGTGAYEEVDIFYRTWREGDTLLLSSDGLHGTLSDEVIANTLLEGLPLQQTADRLVEKAIVAGSTDNVTAVLARQFGEDSL